MNRAKGICVILLILCPLCALAQGGGEGKAYPAAVVVDTLPAMLDNTSTLFFWQGALWTANDHGGLALYELDTLTATVVRRLPAAAANPFVDMEEVAQDEDYFYFGDFGNNHEHLRDDLRVLRVPKARLLEGLCVMDTISFTYEGYDPSGAGRTQLPTTDYDCEAMVAGADSLYLFTKQWTRLQTTCYALPKVPGRYVAEARGSAEVYGLVTGACYQPHRRLLVLSCYTPLCQPFVYLLYGFDGTDFFGGGQLRLPLASGLGVQTEAIATADGLHYYLTNERFSQLGITHPAQLLRLDLTDYLGNHLQGDTTTRVGLGSVVGSGGRFSLSPNPAADHVELLPPTGWAGAAHLSLYDAGGRLVWERTEAVRGAAPLRLDVGQLAAGSYHLVIATRGGYAERHTLIVR